MTVFEKIFENTTATTIKIFEKIVITLALAVAAFSAFVKLSSGDWQLLTNCWIIIAALIAVAYIAKECRVVILKNGLETKEKELKKANTALMIANRDWD